MADINESFLQHEGPTDVITFSYLDDDAVPIDDSEEAVGEIFVCPTIAVEEAEARKQSLDSEIVLYCIHGLLHLSGLDDHSEQDTLEMRSAETKVMGIIESEIVSAPLFEATT